MIILIAMHFMHAAIAAAHIQRVRTCDNGILVFKTT
jgi:hypothetical protein